MLWPYVGCSRHIQLSDHWEVAITLPVILPLSCALPALVNEISQGGVKIQSVVRLPRHFRRPCLANFVWVGGLVYGIFTIGLKSLQRLAKLVLLWVAATYWFRADGTTLIVGLCAVVDSTRTPRVQLTLVNGNYARVGVVTLPWISRMRPL